MVTETSRLHLEFHALTLREAAVELERLASRLEGG